jgi:hypothetical protein
MTTLFIVFFVSAFFHFIYDGIILPNAQLDLHIELKEVYEDFKVKP